MFSGVLALTAKKAKGRHPAAGRVFGASLALTFAAILINIVVAENVFMLGLGWLALYAGAEGWRAAWRYSCAMFVCRRIRSSVGMVES